MTPIWFTAIEAALGRAPLGASALGGGCIDEVYRLEMLGGETLVAKLGRGGDGRLALEGFMLGYLAEHSPLPVPAVLHAADDLLIMEHLPGASRLDGDAERHAAELVAALHGVGAERYGFERHTLIGGLDQPNPWGSSWRVFFRDQRLLYMAGVARDAGRLPGALMARIEALAARLNEWLEEPPRPSLIHGDMWTGNVLAQGGRITGFVDPAIYYADPEIELAFSTLFGTFGEAFFERYGELRPLDPGFFEVRRELYNLYPLLVHVRLFGGAYVGSVESTLKRFGC
jgi:fructosamine-3-kinase